MQSLPLNSPTIRHLFQLHQWPIFFTKLTRSRILAVTSFNILSFDNCNALASVRIQITWKMPCLSVIKDTFANLIFINVSLFGFLQSTRLFRSYTHKNYLNNSIGLIKCIINYNECICGASDMENLHFKTWTSFWKRGLKYELLWNKSIV